MWEGPACFRSKVDSYLERVHDAALSKGIHQVLLEPSYREGIPRPLLVASHACNATKDGRLGWSVALFEMLVFFEIGFQA